MSLSLWTQDDVLAFFLIANWLNRVCHLEKRLVFKAHIITFQCFIIVISFLIQTQCLPTFWLFNRHWTCNVHYGKWTESERGILGQTDYISSAEKSSQAHGKFSREREISVHSNTKRLISSLSNEVFYGLIALRIRVLPFKAKLGSSSISNDVFDSNSSALGLTPCRMNTWHWGTFLTMSLAICTLFCIEPVTSMAMDCDSSWSNWLWSTANSSITLPSARRTPATEVRKAQRRGRKYSASFKRRSSPLKILQCLARSRRTSPCNNGTKPWARRYSNRWNRGI